MVKETLNEKKECDWSKFEKEEFERLIYNPDFGEIPEDPESDDDEEVEQVEKSEKDKLLTKENFNIYFKLLTTPICSRISTLRKIQADHVSNLYLAIKDEKKIQTGKIDKSQKTNSIGRDETKKMIFARQFVDIQEMQMRNIISDHFTRIDELNLKIWDVTEVNSESLAQCLALILIHGPFSAMERSMRQIYDLIPTFEYYSRYIDHASHYNGLTSLEKTFVFLIQKIFKEESDQAFKSEHRPVVTDSLQYGYYTSVDRTNDIIIGSQILLFGDLQSNKAESIKTTTEKDLSSDPVAKLEANNQRLDILIKEFEAGRNKEQENVKRTPKKEDESAMDELKLKYNRGSYRLKAYWTKMECNLDDRVKTKGPLGNNNRKSDGDEDTDDSCSTYSVNSTEVAGKMSKLMESIRQQVYTRISKVNDFTKIPSCYSQRMISRASEIARMSDGNTNKEGRYSENASHK